MIKDFTRNNQAFFKCQECGSEHQILQYFVDNSRTPPTTMIDYEKTDSELAAFIATHKLCKSNSKQLKIVNLHHSEN